MTFGISKKNGILHFRDICGYETRNPSTFWCIQQADDIYHWNDFEEQLIHTSDYEYDNNHYTYSKRNSYHKLVPDFNFHAWPQVGINDYESFTKEIDQAGLQPYELNKVGWIGNSNTHYRRKQLVEIGHHHNELFDIIDMSWSASGNVFLNSTTYLPTPKLVATYAMLIDIEGNGYSGRLKHLLWSHRPLLLVDRPHKEFFFEHLKEWEHYIPVSNDLSDLVEKTKWCIEHYDKALQMAENAYQFSKTHLSREACYAKWNDIISSFIEKH